MCLQPRKHTVLPCHLCLLLPSPVLNSPVPYFLPPAVWKTEEADVPVLVHSLFAAHTWLPGYSNLVFLPSPLIACRDLSWHMGLLRRLMFHSVYKHGLSVCSVAFARCWMSIQIMNTRVTDCWDWYCLLNQSQFPGFSKTGWIISLKASPAFCKWWGNLVSL